MSNASTQIKLFQATDASGNYPTANTCPITSDAKICLKASNDNTYTPSNATDLKTYILTAVNDALSYQITNDSSPFITPTSLAVTNPANWLTIGTQVWAKANLNVGNKISGVTAQTNNLNLEKYCYNDSDSNCVTYGCLYQWDEAMQYVITEGAQGICPTSSHIPTDTEWITLETYLGSTTAGIQLKPGGLSCLNILLAGDRFIDGTFYDLLSNALLWTSINSGTKVWDRYLISNSDVVGRTSDPKSYGFSVRCIGN